MSFCFKTLLGYSVLKMLFCLTHGWASPCFKPQDWSRKQRFRQEDRPQKHFVVAETTIYPTINDGNQMHIILKREIGSVVIQMSGINVLPVQKASIFGIFPSTIIVMGMVCLAFAIITAYANGLSMMVMRHIQGHDHCYQCNHQSHNRYVTFTKIHDSNCKGNHYFLNSNINMTDFFCLPEWLLAIFAQVLCS